MRLATALRRGALRGRSHDVTDADITWKERTAASIAENFGPDDLFTRNGVCEALGLGYHESEDASVESQRVSVYFAVHRLKQDGKIRRVVDVHRQRHGQDYVRYLRA